MNKRFFNQQNLTRRLRLLSVLFAMLLLPLGAWAVDYDIVVGGVQVTSDNAANVLGDGTVSFTEGVGADTTPPYTLTLNGATLTDPVTTGLPNLTIHLIGTNTIALNGSGAVLNSTNSNAALTITKEDASASLTISNKYASGQQYPVIFNFASVSYPDLNLISPFPTTYEYVSNGDIQGKGLNYLYKNHALPPSPVTFSSVTTYPMWVAGTQVTENNKNNITGKTTPEVTFTPASGDNAARLSLSSATFEGKIYCKGDLEVYFSGENTITAPDTAAIIRPIDGNSKLYLTNADDQSSLVLTNNLTIWQTVIHSFTSIELAEGLYQETKTAVAYGSTPDNSEYYNIGYFDPMSKYPINYLKLTTTSNYPLWIGGVQVTTANASAVTKAGVISGAVSYNATNNIVTLSNATISSEDGGIKYAGDQSLVIKLNGVNNIANSSHSQNGIMFFYPGTEVGLTIKKADDSEGCSLEISSNDDACSVIKGFYTVTWPDMDVNPEDAVYKDGELSHSTGGLIDYVTFSDLENCPLTVGGIQVTTANASNIFGQDYASASYDNTSNILTLSGCQYGGTTSGFVSIDGSLESLTLHLVGINDVGYGAAKVFTSTNACAVNITTAAVPGKLQYYGESSDMTNNVTLNYGTSGLALDGTTIQAASGTTDIKYFGIGQFHDGTDGDSPLKEQGYPYWDYSGWYYTNAHSTNNNTNLPPTVTSSAGDDGYVSRLRTSGNDVIKSLTFQCVPVSGGTVNVALMSLDGETTYATGAFSNGLVTLTPNTLVTYDDVSMTFTSESAFSFVPMAVKTVVPESYNITVAGVQVTDQNAEDILGNSTVSYDAENHKLTLNNANLTSPIHWGTDADLTIELKGTNSMNTTNGVCITSEFEREISFTEGGDNCSLELSRVTDDNFFSGFSNTDNPSMGTGMYWIPTWNNDQITSVLITNSLLGGGKGTEESPFIISSFEHLKTFAKYVNDGILSTEYIKLGANIDCTDETGFEPIGNTPKSFIGTFNGDGNSITGLTFSNTNPDGVAGLFGNIGSYNSNNDVITMGTVKNLTLNGCQFGNGARNGAIAGYLNYGTIEECTVTSCIISSGNAISTYSGGITGMVVDGIVKDCTVNGGTITSSTTDSNSGEVCAGGIVAYAYGSSEINGCTVADVSINSTGINQNSCSGGIVGYSEAIISGNSVKGTTTVNSINNDNNFINLAGAIVANRAEGSLTNNYYYYTVKTKTTLGNNDPVEKSGYIQRALGNGDDVSADNGAVMYTKSLTVGITSECEVYEPLSNSQSGIWALAPGQTVDLSLYPEVGKIISVASLVYTPTGGTEQTVVPLENESETAGEYNYVFEMPDANATLNTTLVQGYDLWIGGTQVSDANKDHVLGEGNTTVTFAVTGNEAAGSVNTLTLNGAALTVPVKVGLDNLTIDIQGSNTITTDTTCIQNIAATGVPSLTFKSTSDVVGNLTLKNNDVDDTGVISDDYFEYFTISKELALIMLNYGSYTSNTYYFTGGQVHDAQFVPSYGVQVNDMQVYEGNVEDVLGDGKVSFDKSTHTLTLDNASGISTISTTLSTLDIDLVGSNSLYRSSDGSIFESASGEAVTINLKSTGATKGSLTMKTQENSGATLKGDNVTLTPVDPIVLLSSDVTENKGTLVYGVSYGLTVAGVTVSNANASNVLGGETATVVFTPANATEATPATLTLNGANFTGSIVSGLENLTVVINGENTIGKIEGNTTTNTDKNITFKGGTDGSTLTITSTLNSALEGFAAVSYDGAYPASPIPSKYYTGYQKYIAVHGSDINYPLQTLTISTTPHYPLWIGATQINDNNKDDVFAGTALGGKVSYNSTSKTLSLTNAELSSHYIMSDLDALRISVEGDCVIAAADTSAAVRSMNGAATLTIAKKNSSSTDISTLKLGTDFSTASISWFNSVDYSDFILLSEGATYEDKLLKDSDGESLTQATFTSGLKKPTIQMNYENDTYSFQNPNGGGTLKYKRTYIDGTETVNDEGEMSNTTFNIDGRPDYFEVWVEANGNSSDKLYACRLDVEDMTTTYGGTVPDPVFLPKSVEGVTVSGYSLGDHTEVAATVTEGNITLTGAGRQELDAIFSIPDGVEYIKTSTTETPKATFFLDVKPATPILSKATGSYAGTQTITVTNLTPNATAMYYTYEGEEPENPNAQAFPEGGVDISSSKTLAVYYVASYETETSTEYLYSETVRETYTILEDPELAYKQGETAVTTAEWILGKDENVLPTLYNPYDLAPVTYESNNTDVATVATDGTVTVVGIGTAVITATTVETDVYVAGEASYTLTVKRQLDVSFASNTWATYCGTENLATPEGLTAYQVTAVDGLTVTIEEIGYIPANTAVLLNDVEGKAVSANIAASAYEGETTTFPDNILQGGVAVDVSTITGGTVYVLYKDMFKRATGGTIPANRGYLVVAPSSGNAPELSITIGDDTTGIGTVGCDSVATDNDEWYTLDGQKLQQAPTQKGLYIKNGKKVVINKK